jgi:maltooligosyltrehalose trehalohydrolase
MKPIGHVKTGDSSYRFTVWAPKVLTLDLGILRSTTEWVPMNSLQNGFFSIEVDGLSPQTLYRFRLDGELLRPDPASHHQPRDVHGPSAVVDHDGFAWADQDYRPPHLAEIILYEIHIGTFTRAGTFDAAIARLDDLAALGVTALELMPVGQFPGARNWGYDGVQPFAVQHSYGGPAGMKRFVNACHARGLAVFLDVVYNHLGPEGNYLRDFGPYFTDRARTAWGEAVNFDGPYSDQVRGYFLQNALHWVDRYHIDGLRLDATHAIHDERPTPFLQELAGTLRSHKRITGRVPLILAESDLNEPRLIRPSRRGGLGLDGMFSEDFHHAVHALLTGENQGYYRDYGRIEHLIKVLGTGLTYTGQYSEYRRKTHGAPPGRLPPEAFTVFIQNHDQVGNRAQGERLASLVSFEASKTAAGLVLLSPFTPMLFMGEEYGENNPFFYFISHIGPDLRRAVADGRKREFAQFHQSRVAPPDPAAETTFLRSRLAWRKRLAGRGKILVDFYRELIRLRKARPLRGSRGRRFARVAPLPGGNGISLAGGEAGKPVLVLFNLSERHLRPFQHNAAKWLGYQKVLDSADERHGGPGSAMPPVPEKNATLRPWSLALYWGEEAGS